MKAILSWLIPAALLLVSCGEEGEAMGSREFSAGALVLECGANRSGTFFSMQQGLISSGTGRVWTGQVFVDT